jgi:hypothetical protein
MRDNSFLPRGENMGSPIKILWVSSDAPENFFATAAHEAETSLEFVNIDAWPCAGCNDTARTTLCATCRQATQARADLVLVYIMGPGLQLAKCIRPQPNRTYIIWRTLSFLNQEMQFEYSALGLSNFISGRELEQRLPTIIAEILTRKETAPLH